MSTSSILTDNSPLAILFNVSSAFQLIGKSTAGNSQLIRTLTSPGYNIPPGDIYYTWIKQAMATAGLATYTDGYGNIAAYDLKSVQITKPPLFPDTTVNTGIMTQLSGMSCSWTMYPKSAKTTFMLQALNRTKSQFWCSLFGASLPNDIVWMAGEYKKMASTCGQLKYTETGGDMPVYVFDNAKNGNYGINTSIIEDISLSPGDYFSSVDGVFFDIASSSRKLTDLVIPTRICRQSEEVEEFDILEYLLIDVQNVTICDGVTFSINFGQFNPTQPNYDLKIRSIYESFKTNMIPTPIIDAILNVWFQIYSYDLKSLTLRSGNFILDCDESNIDCTSNEEYNKVGYCIKTTIGSDYCKSNPNYCNLAFSKICVETPVAKMESLKSTFYPRDMENQEIYIASPTCDYWYNKINKTKTAYVQNEDGTTCKRIPWVNEDPPNTPPFIPPNDNCNSFLLDNPGINFGSNYIAENCNYIYNYYACVCPDSQITDASGNPVITTLCQGYDPGNGLNQEEKCNVYKYLLTNGGACSCFLGEDQAFDYYERTLSDPAFKGDLVKFSGISPTCLPTCYKYSSNCTGKGCGNPNTGVTYSEPCTQNLCIIKSSILTGDVKADKANIGNIIQNCGLTSVKYDCINNECLPSENGQYQNYEDCITKCPGNLYKCIEGKCQVTAGGDPLQTCLSECENTGMKFLCNSFEQTCQQDSTGASSQNYNTCAAGCTSETIKKIRIGVIIFLTLLIFILIILLIVSK